MKIFTSANVRLYLQLFEQSFIPITSSLFVFSINELDSSNLETSKLVGICFAECLRGVDQAYSESVLSKLSPNMKKNVTACMHEINEIEQGYFDQVSDADLDVYLIYVDAVGKDVLQQYQRGETECLVNLSGCVWMQNIITHLALSGREISFDPRPLADS